MKLCFGDIVVVDEAQIGVVVKSWCGSLQGRPPSYDVYLGRCPAGPGPPPR